MNCFFTPVFLLPYLANSKKYLVEVKEDSSNEDMLRPGSKKQDYSALSGFGELGELPSFFTIPKEEAPSPSTPMPTQKIKSPPVTQSYKEEPEVPFTPTCGLAYESAGKIRGPIPIGGLCGDRETTKECDGKCIPRSEVCGGKCTRNQCLKKDKSSCVEMFVDGNEFGKMLFKDCEGHCIPASKKCGDHCHDTQCWEPGSQICLNPDKDRTEEQVEKGVYSWKNCQGICKKSSEICDNSCGSPSLFCWDERSKKCLSLEEKTEFGKKLRSHCKCKCIPFGEKCSGNCGVAQCDEGGKCVDALELNEENERIRKTCEGKCIPWDQECSLYQEW